MSEPEQGFNALSERDALRRAGQVSDHDLESIRNTGMPEQSGWSGGSNASPPTDGQSGSEGQGMVDKVVSTTTQKASDMTDQATSKVDAGMEKAAGGLGTVAEAIRGKSESMPEGQMQSIATTAAEKIESGAEMLRQKDSDQMIADLEAFVRSKPVESLLVAAGIGFLFSKAMR